MAMINNKTRTISVVGNAESLFSKNYGIQIDNSEIVIRFNDGIIKHANSQGYRTDILVYSILSKYHKNAKKFKERVMEWNTKKFKERKYLEEKHGVKPSNGLVVLEKIKNEFPNVMVKIFGFDWKKTKTFYHTDEIEELKNDKKEHNYAFEKEYVIKIIKKKKWVLYS